MKQAILCLFAVSVLVAVGLPAAAQSGGGYDLTWHTIDGGGYTWSEGGGYMLGGTVGQPDAGGALTGGDYILVGGFWVGSGGRYRVYLPLVLKSS